MENDIDTNEYYASYHVKGWFDCCWITPKIRLPKHIGRGYINGVVDNDEIRNIIKESDWARYGSVDNDSIEILNVYKEKRKV